MPTTAARARISLSARRSSPAPGVDSSTVMLAPPAYGGPSARGRRVLVVLDSGLFDCYRVQRRSRAADHRERRSGEKHLVDAVLPARVREIIEIEVLADLKAEV